MANIKLFYNRRTPANNLSCATPTLKVLCCKIVVAVNVYHLPDSAIYPSTSGWLLFTSFMWAVQCDFPKLPRHPKQQPLSKVPVRARWLGGNKWWLRGVPPKLVGSSKFNEKKKKKHSILWVMIIIIC